MSSPTTPPANSTVHADLLHGKPVRFDTEKETEKEREVPAEWVAEALREGRRVELKDAILTGPLDLRSAHVEQEFILLGGEVRGPVNAFYTRFARWVVFRNVRFQDSVNFKGSRFAAELNCTGAHFLKGVTFEDSIIEGSFLSPGAEFGSSEENPVGFNNCEIRRAADFVSAVFHGPAQFTSLTIGKLANFSGARFEKEVVFDRAEIGGDFFFRPQREQRVEFGGEARFVGIKVGGQTNFRGARFEKEVVFDQAEIGGSFFFRPQGEQRVEFGGEARFLGVKVGGQADFSGARFEHGAAFDGAEIGGDFFFRPEGEQRVEFGGEARFHGVKVGGQATFSGARFEQKVAFDRAEIGGSFFFRPEGEQRVEFVGEARFTGVKVGGQASFSGARFAKPAAFEGAEIRGDLFFCAEGKHRVEFGGEARFLGIKVGGPATFSGARFAKPAFFDGAVFSGPPFFQEAGFSALASFVNARFQLAAEFQGAQFQGPANFDYARFEQEVHFAGAEFHNQLKLRDARMTTLSFLEEHEEKEVAVFHPGFKVDLLGCAYGRLEIDGWRKLMDRQSEFNPRPWSHLEKTLRAAGHKTEADDVYFNRRKQERKLLPWNRWVRRLADILEWVFTGYGVRNGRVVLSILALLLLGTVVFQLPGAIVPALEHLAVAEKEGAFSPEETLELEWDSALGFSFKQLLPVSIPVLRQYEPAPGWASLYASLHMLLGIVFITTAFATLSGLMRRAHPD